MKDGKRRRAKASVPASRGILAALRRIWFGKRFLQSLERNREAADTLDALLKDLLEQ